MDYRAKIKAEIEAIEEGGNAGVNMFQDGGAEVYRVNYDWYVLFEIPLYGGEPQYIDTYHMKAMDQMVDVIAKMA